MKKILIVLLLAISVHIQAQRTYWQQSVEYTMDIDMNVKDNQFVGKQTLKYTNNSPDTLNKVFYHLYFNAFQPGSSMDERNKVLPDSDPRVKDRITKLKPEEYGYQKVMSLTMNGEELSYQTTGTVLEVELKKTIAPQETAVFEMNFEGQVPIQIRRSGRDNKEGIRYSMAQWYPKMAEYDYKGWHTDPYIGREFYGVYGTFDVTINIDKEYIVGGTGVLQNASEIGYGYEKKDEKVKQSPNDKNQLSWNFKAENVHDFVWAADMKYKHIKKTRKDGVVLHALYVPKDNGNEEDWIRLLDIMDEAFTYIEKHYGEYPYEQYSFIQGGDGGMEYPMATLITGHRVLGSLVGVSVHEVFHSWFQGVLGTNESLYPWMDEGFTSYGSSMTMNYLRSKKLIPGDVVHDPAKEAVFGMVNFHKSGRSEAISTHSDHYSTNAAYSVASYVKGSAYLHQLQYIIGKDAFNRGMLRYYNEWKFKHPAPNDFLRVMEKESGLELDWFNQYFIYTDELPNYAVMGFKEEKKGVTLIKLARIGKFPMPLDVVVTYEDDTKELFYIPLEIMRGEKADEGLYDKRTVMKDWSWTSPTYDLFIRSSKKNKVKSIEIDPSQRMADTELANNVAFMQKIQKKKSR